MNCEEEKLNLWRREKAKHIYNPNKKVVALFVILILSISIPTLADVNTTKPQLQKGMFVFFGHYEQDDNLSNGPELIGWEILSTTDGKFLLISTNCLEFMEFNDNLKENRWEKSTIRQWLNNEFYTTAFSFEEKEAVCPTIIDNSFSEQYIEYYSHYSWINNKPSPDTYDRVFLLSTREYESLNPHSCNYSEHVINQITEYEKEYKTSNSLRNRSYWLRSENWDPWSVDTVSEYDLSGCMVNSEACCRPVICVDKQKLYSLSESFSLVYNPFSSYSKYEEYTYIEALKHLQDAGFSNISVIGETTKKHWFFSTDYLVGSIIIGNEIIYVHDYSHYSVKDKEMTWQSGFPPEEQIVIYMSEYESGNINF